MPDLDARDELERDLGAVLEKAFNQARRQLTETLYREGMTASDLANVPFDTLFDIRQSMIIGIQPVLERGYVEAARNFAEQIQYGISDDVIDDAASNWSRTFTPQLVDGVLSSSRRRLSDIAARGAELPVSRSSLRNILAAIFSVSRITTIARTEVTNAISAGETTVQRELERAGMRVTEVWFSQFDERVCPQCGPLHGLEKGDGWQKDPPIHPRCRCYKGYRIENNGQVVILFDDEAVSRRLRQPRG